MDDTRIGFTVTPADNGYIVERREITPSGLPGRRATTLITPHPISGSAEHRLVKFIAELVDHKGSVKAPPGDTDICRGVVQ